MNRTFQKLEKVLGEENLPNTSQVGKETITLWYDGKRGDVYGLGPGRPKGASIIAAGRVYMESMWIKYDPELRCPIGELADGFGAYSGDRIANTTMTKAMQIALHNVEYYRLMKQKSLNNSSA